MYTCIWLMLIAIINRFLELSHIQVNQELTDDPAPAHYQVYTLYTTVTCAYPDLLLSLINFIWNV